LEILPIGKTAKAMRQSRQFAADPIQKESSPLKLRDFRRKIGRICIRRRAAILFRLPCRFEPA
jgi:hypothetical protein